MSWLFLCEQLWRFVDRGAGGEVCDVANWRARGAADCGEDSCDATAEGIVAEEGVVFRSDGEADRGTDAGTDAQAGDGRTSAMREFDTADASARIGSLVTATAASDGVKIRAEE